MTKLWEIDNRIHYDSFHGVDMLGRGVYYYDFYVYRKYRFWLPKKWVFECTTINFDDGIKRCNKRLGIKHNK